MKLQNQKLKMELERNRYELTKAGKKESNFETKEKSLLSQISVLRENIAQRQRNDEEKKGKGKGGKVETCRITGKEETRKGDFV